METQNLEFTFKFNGKSTLVKVIQSKKEIAAFCKKHGRRPSFQSKNRNERDLAIKLRNYTSPNYVSFDPVFVQLMNNFVKTRYVNSLDKLDKDIKELENFVKKHKRKPNWSSSKESKLYRKFQRIVKKAKNLKTVTMEQKNRIKRIKSFPTLAKLNRSKCDYFELEVLE